MTLYIAITNQRNEHEATSQSSSNEYTALLIKTSLIILLK